MRSLPILGLLIIACSPPPMPPPVDAGQNECFDDKDCGNTALFFCNTSTSQCQPGCKVKADCTAAVRKTDALAECAGALGCECDVGVCKPALCSGDTQCAATEVCRDGACATAPDVNLAVAGCSVVPDRVILRQGDKATFTVLAWDAQRSPVVPQNALAWSAALPAVTGTGAGRSAEFTAAQPNLTAQPAVRATVGMKTCFAGVRVLSSAAPAAGQLDVVVTDELTGRPIPNVAVLASEPLTGVAIGAAVNTDAEGVARIPGLAAQTAVTVTAFHGDFGYLTIANYGLSGSRVLAMPLRRNPLDKFGGYAGTVKNAPNTANLHLALAGTSVAGLVSDLSMTDLSFASLVGRNVVSPFQVGTAVNGPLPLPAGLFVGMTGQTSKTRVAALGQAGVCVDAAGVADEAATANGVCGARTAWAFVGDIPLGDVPIDLFARGFAAVNFLQFLKRMGPDFRKFQSSVVRDVQFGLQATPLLADGGYETNSADAGFAVVDHSYTQGLVPLGFDRAVNVPDLPRFEGNFPDTVMLFGGAFAAGRGLVPLGMGVADNVKPVDVKTDAQGLGPGLVTLRTSPMHHGLEGSAYGVVAMAMPSTAAAWPGLMTSALVLRTNEAALTFSPKGTPIDLAAVGEFPKVATAARYDYLGTRTWTATLPVDAQVSVVRVVFTDAAEHAWTVWVEPGQGFTLPAPVGAFADRTFWSGMTTGERSGFFVQPVRLPGVSFTQLVELNGTNGDRIGELATGFSLVDYQRPTITWTVPLVAGTVVPKGSPVIVTVRGFRVGVDGNVRLSFSPATPGCPEVIGNKEETVGKGDVVLMVPATCTLQGATLAATLVSTSGAAVLPPVGAGLVANVQ